MLNLNWGKYDNGEWCGLINLNLNNPFFENLEGVYVIWHGGLQPRWVRVGQGNIRDRLGKHREDNDILAYKGHGLYVTWAPVNANIRDGIERYLGESLNPLVGSRFPDVLPIPVNIP